jgi:hypothetical protein
LGAQGDADAVAAHAVRAAQLEDLDEEAGDGRAALDGHLLELPRLRVAVAVAVVMAVVVAEVVS